MPEGTIRAVDDWATKNQAPTRGDAIRRLVELGLASARPAPRRSKKATSRATELAGREIDTLGDKSAPAEERASRKRRLLKGPAEFRDVRTDHPKAKNEK